MKKTFILLASILIAGIALDSCKKGKDDPFISLHSRKARLVGSWTMSSGTMTSVSGNNTSTTTISGTTLTMVNTSPSSTTTGTYADKLTIAKDGTWNEAITETATGYSRTITTSGTWNWTGRVGPLKNKEQVAMATLSSTTTTSPGSTTVDTYTGSDAPVTIYEIDQLKNKTLRIIWTGTTSSGGSPSSDTGDVTYTQ